MILAMPLVTQQLLRAKSHLKTNPPGRARRPVPEEKNLDFAS
jgi:hypothetical protein